MLLFDSQKAYPGLTVFNSRHSNRVRAIDLTGRIQQDFRAPDPRGEGLHVVEQDSNGDYLTIVQVRSLTKISKEGQIQWTLGINAHHDVLELPTGSFLTFDLTRQSLQHEGESFDAWVDSIVEVSADGKILNRYAFKHLLAPYVGREMLEKSRKKLQDVFHCNGLARVPKAIGPHINAGDILLSCRDLNLLFICDPTFTQMKWHFGSNTLENQHNPSILEDGTILLLDNRPSRKHSRLVRISIEQKIITWEFTFPQRAAAFFTRTMGGVQLLPNENLLVTLSNTGHVLEFTEQGELVWEFINPEQYRGTPAKIYRATRIDPPQH